MSLERAKALFVELGANVQPEHWEARLADQAGDDGELPLQPNRAEQQLLEAFAGLKQLETKNAVEAKGRVVETQERLMQHYDDWNKNDEADGERNLRF